MRRLHREPERFGENVVTVTTWTDSRPALVASRVLKAAVAFWFVAALIGQWVFFYYIAVFYGPSTLTGNFQAWTKNHNLIKGYIPGDTPGNLTFGVHALLAGYVAFGGALQIIPQLRSIAPRFHRWNGRTFLVTAFVLSVTGLYMIWIRGAVTNMTGSVAISLDAALIILFAILAWRAARRRDFDVHRRHALRTWLVANGQWFFRVGVFGWILVNHGPVGFGGHFDGPIIVFWEFGCYLLPLTVLELYLRTTEGTSLRARYAMAGALIALTLIMSAGVVGAYLITWQPVLARI